MNKLDAIVEESYGPLEAQVKCLNAMHMFLEGKILADFHQEAERKALREIVSRNLETLILYSLNEMCWDDLDYNRKEVEAMVGELLKERR